MKLYTKDILFTLAVKICLLYGLWFFCVKPTPSHWVNSKDWFLKHSFQTHLKSSTVSHPSTKV